MPATVEWDGLYYVICVVMPWTSLQITGLIQAPINRMIDASNPVGFMPVFKTREDAERFKADAGNGPAAEGHIMTMVSESRS